LEPTAAVNLAAFGGVALRRKAFISLLLIIFQNPTFRRTGGALAT